MALLDIISVPDPLLKTISTPVEKVDDDIRTLLDNMLDTMYAAPGIGLSAIQVAVPKRVIVMDTEGDLENPQPRFIVNPEITWASEEINHYNEGCLSVPEHYADVARPAAVRVTYLNRDGERVEEEMDGINATCIQHEIDHLDGIVFVDYLSKLKRDMIIKKVVKASRA